MTTLPRVRVAAPTMASTAMLNPNAGTVMVSTMPWRSLIGVAWCAAIRSASTAAMRYSSMAGAAAAVAMAATRATFCSREMG